MRRLFTLGIYLFSILLLDLSHGKNEEWYLYSAYGGSSPQGNLAIDNNKYNDQYIGRTKVSADILGVYVPVYSDYFAMGPLINTTAYYYSDSDYSDNLLLTMKTISLSAFYFPSQITGEGLFFKGDFGLSFIDEVQSTTDENRQNRYSGKSTIFGQSIGIGLGYGFPITSGSRMLIQGNSVTRSAGNRDFSDLNYLLGILW